MTASEDPTKNLRVPAYVFKTAAIVTAEPGVTSSTPWFRRAVESAFMNGYVAGHRAGREDAVPPEHVADAAARLRQDIREAIDVCYGELGGEADTPEDVAGTERAIAHDMATVLDWVARGLQPQETATAATDRSAP